MMSLAMSFGIQNTTWQYEEIECIFIWMSSPSNFNMRNRPFHSPKSAVAFWPCEFFMLIWKLALEQLKYQCSWSYFAVLSLHQAYDINVKEETCVLLT